MFQTISGGCVSVERMVVGPIENNVYIISDGASTLLVDPGFSPWGLRAAIGNRKVDAIVLTHRHWDHVGAASAMRDATGAPVIASKEDGMIINGEVPNPETDTDFKPCPIDRFVEDGEIVEVGDMKWKVIATPGHTKGGICLYLDAAQTDNPDAMNILITGDTLFERAIGRTDFEGGSIDDMRESLSKLAELPDNTMVLTGHNRLTTIADSRITVFAHYLKKR